MPRPAACGAAIALVLALALALGGCAGAPGGSAPAGTRVEFSPAHHNRHNALIRVVTARRLVASTTDRTLVIRDRCCAA